MTGDLLVMSAGAIEPGLRASAELYRERFAQRVQIAWATTPVIRERIERGDKVDAVIATDAAIADFARSGRVQASHAVHVGRVGVGVAVREDAAPPDLSSVAALRRAVLEADTVLFTRASSGLYVERMLSGLGVLERIQDRILRFANGPAMMERLVKGSGHEIGFGAIVEILMYGNQGLRLAGPLPDEVQQHARYVAAPVIGARDPRAAKSFVDFLATPAAKALFAACGVE